MLTTQKVLKSGPFENTQLFQEPNVLFSFSNTIVEATLNGGIVHVVAQFHGRTLHDVKHNVCKVDAKSFGCPMHKGNKYKQLSFQDQPQLPTLKGVTLQTNKEIQLKQLSLSISGTRCALLSLESVVGQLILGLGLKSQLSPAVSLTIGEGERLRGGGGEETTVLSVTKHNNHQSVDQPKPLQNRGEHLLSRNLQDAWENDHCW